MASKYDAFWEQRREALARLLDEAFTYGRSQPLPVPELPMIGNRKRWSGRVSVAAGSARKAQGAHARSLGHLLGPLSARYPDIAFRARITEDLHLWIERVESEVRRATDYTAPAGGPPRRRPPASGSGWGPGGRDPSQVAQRVHELVWRLPRLTSLPERSALPSDGIYFWFESGEGSPEHPRIVRVGINRSAGRFPDRLRQHYRGSRRRSALRFLLGDALLRRHGDGARWQCWQKRKGAPLPEVEDEITALLAERFSFACLVVDDSAERKRLEKWLIACLARSRWPEPSSDWLGHHSSRPQVRQSGLWNVAGVRARTGDMDCRYWLARLEELVKQM